MKPVERNVWILRWRAMKPLLDRGVACASDSGMVRVRLGRVTIHARPENVFTELRAAQAAYAMAERAYALALLADEVRDFGETDGSKLLRNPR